jgi:hypothetical protein
MILLNNRLLRLEIGRLPQWSGIPYGIQITYKPRPASDGLRFAPETHTWAWRCIWIGAGPCQHRIYVDDQYVAIQASMVYWRWPFFAGSY